MRLISVDKIVVSLRKLVLLLAEKISSAISVQSCLKQALASSVSPLSGNASAQDNSALNV